MSATSTLPWRRSRRPKSTGRISRARTARICSCATTRGIDTTSSSPPVTRGIDLKRLNAALGEDRLSFASPERLRRWLGVEPGSVSPFGLINDGTHHVRVVCDEALRSSAALGFHPNVNTATLEIAFADFEKFLAARGNDVRWLEL